MTVTVTSSMTILSASGKLFEVEALEGTSIPDSFTAFLRDGVASIREVPQEKFPEEGTYTVMVKYKGENNLCRLTISFGEGQSSDPKVLAKEITGKEVESAWIWFKHPF